MSFLDEVDSIKQKAGITKPKLPLILAIGLAVVLVLIFAAGTLWTNLSTPSLEIVHSDEQVDQTNTTSSDLDTSQSGNIAQSSLYIHVTGCVVNPGLYELSSGSRVSDAITAAGGFNADANDSSINLARELTDGEQVVVGSLTDTQASAPTTSGDSPSGSSTGVVSEKVNINIASADELMTLDGVGEATAEKIIAYREEQGPFASIEEIKEVSGIGDKKYESMKDLITV